MIESETIVVVLVEVVIYTTVTQLTETKFASQNPKKSLSLLTYNDSGC